MSAAAFTFAERLGRLARESGRSKRQNPYDRRAMSFRFAWFRGWVAADREATQQRKADQEAHHVVSSRA